MIMAPSASPARNPACLAACRAAGVRYFSTEQRSQKQTAAIITRLRQKEEETKKYGAPKFQALFFGLAGVGALGFGVWGWTQMDTRLGSIRSRSGW
mmetsp:Transcript_7778/g.15296  ORF Transcript_7778/g.15296 Transcript_7778/m.15296 type:complete len:96 (-) Transcript_7778:84-371(-)